MLMKAIQGECEWLDERATCVGAGLIEREEGPLLQVIVATRRGTVILEGSPESASDQKMVNQVRCAEDLLRSDRFSDE